MRCLTGFTIPSKPRKKAVDKVGTLWDTFPVSEIKVHINAMRDGNLKERIEAAARSAHVSLSAWCRIALNEASYKRLPRKKESK